MLVAAVHLVDFWLMPWSAPFRAACLWFTPATQPLRGKRPDADAPRWLRPFCLQRWVGQAVAARLKANPRTTAYRYGPESDPRWDEAAWVSYERRVLRQFSVERLLCMFGAQVERLLRIAQEHPKLVDGDWTSAALGASEHIAQLYAELKRRYKAMQARSLLREELRRFVAWDGQGGKDAISGSCGGL